MTDIKIITPPDRVYDNGYDILVICPSDFTKTELSKILELSEIAVNIYWYSEVEVSDWLLTSFRHAQVAIIDLDNSSPEIRAFAPYFLAFNKTHWLTNADNPLYNRINKNQVYNFDFLLTKIKE